MSGMESMKKILVATVTALTLALISILVFANYVGLTNFSSLSTAPVPSPSIPTFTVPDDFPTIGSAIANASSGYKILVKNGTYNEASLNITKSLTIVSEYQNGAQIIIYPSTERVAHLFYWDDRYLDALQINADNVVLSGFSITFDRSNSSIVGDASHFVVVGNGVQVLDNTMQEANLLFNGSQGKVTDNLMNSLTLSGSNHTIENNKIINNIELTGELNLIKQNQVPTISIKGNNNTISSNNVVGNGTVGIELIANYNLVWNNTIIVKNYSTSRGIYIGSGGEESRAAYNFFGGNKISHTQGVAIYVNCGYNVFYGNVVGNPDCCVRLGSAGGNLFFGNSFRGYISYSNNVLTINVPSPSNSFDNGSMGNYWHNRVGKSSDPLYNDGADGFDHFPLSESPGILTDFPCLPSPWNVIVFTLKSNS